MSTFEDWRDGAMSDEQAARYLALELGEVESELAPLNAQRETLRAGLSHIVGKLGDKHTIPGFGRLENTKPSVITSYDKAEIEALILEMTAAGAHEWAQKLVNCRHGSMRAGSLRITREK